MSAISAPKATILKQLQSELLHIQGFKSINSSNNLRILAPLCLAFPNATFPTGALHEFISDSKEDLSATSGFITAMLASLVSSDGVVVWISSYRKLFPPGLQVFGVNPDRILFIYVPAREVLWAMEEVLKCPALAAVVGELRNLSFTESRRLQLAVEKSNVTGFVLRTPGPATGTTACVSRWKITSLPSTPVDELPGIGYIHWRAELMRVRNGHPRAWNLEWKNNQFAESAVEAQQSIAPSAQTFKQVG